MYQLLAGIIIVVCFILGMNSRSFSGDNNERKVPPDPGKPGVKNARTRENVRDDLTRLAKADNAISSDQNAPVRAMCYEVVAPPIKDIPDPYAGAGDTSSVSTDAAAPVEAKDAKTASRSRENLRAELSKLSKSTPPDPDSLIHHATCYAPMKPVTQLEYSCEKCKEKTVYKVNYEVKTIGGGSAWGEIGEISEIRSLARGISDKNLTIYLDESACCSKCSNGKQNGEVFLEVSYPGEAKPVRTKINAMDMRALLALLSGSDRVGTYGPDAAPLKDSLKRLEEILGIKADAK